ncbi:MAG: hypothetical protein A7315_02860 [Candidatus Altiarchaeales archaeon WOR_SM1_79]|nr:MAG: hypothetical protein A7315_02860 [Candidatus Altiarchaeales archaeon WOR_SM1_79]
MKDNASRIIALIMIVTLITVGYLNIFPQSQKILENDTPKNLYENNFLEGAIPLPRGTRSDTSWPMHRYDLSHSGFTTSSVPFDNSILWSNTTGNGDGYGSPVVEYGKVFIGSADGYLYCFDLDTGERLWRTFLSSADFGIPGTPAVANDHVVVFCSGTDALYRLRVSDGGINWTYDPGGGAYGGSSPVISNGKVYFGSGNRYLYCVNETTGALVWSYQTGVGPVRPYGIQSSPAVANGRIFVGSCDCYLYCFNETQPTAPNAQYYWRANLFDAIFGSPAIANGRVYCGSGYYVYSEGTNSHRMFCFDELTGGVIWSYQTGSDILSSPAIAYDNCYFTSTDGELYCLYAESSGPTPTLFWSNTTGDSWSSPAVSDGKVMVGSTGTNRIYCFNATTGTLLWDYNAGNDVYSSPAIADGKVVVGVRGSPERVLCFGTTVVPTIDRIEIRNQPNNGGIAISDQTIGVGKQITGYAAAYNDTYGYISDIPVNWSVITGGGSNASTNPTFFIPSSNFYSGFYGGTATWTAEDGNGHSDSVLFTINSPRIDYIRIVDNEGTGTNEILAQTVDINFTIKGYVASFNNTIHYLGDVIVNWSVTNISGATAFTSPLKGANSTFSANLTGGVAIWTADDGNGHSDDVQITIRDPEVDYIRIVDNENLGSSEIMDNIVDVGYSIKGYAAGYNNTVGYIGDISVTWSVINSSGAEGNTFPISGTNSTVNVGLRGGTVELIADDGDGHTDSVIFSVRQPEFDYIMIRTGPNGTGGWVGDSTYIFGDSDIFYAAGYNNTAGWTQDVSANWSSDNISFGDVDPGPSNFTTFYALNNGTCIITAIYDSFSNSTGVIFIINYSTDYIVIRDLPGGAGSSVGDRFYNIGQTAIFYAAAYNTTVGFLGGVGVQWECSNTSIATVTSPGSSTTFSAKLVSGDCVVTARYNSSISNITGTLTVISATLDYILITESPNGLELTMVNLNIGKSKELFASGYNSTGPTFVGLIEVQWTRSPSIGSLIPSLGISTLFTAGMTGGSTTVTAMNSTLNLSDDLTITVKTPTVDFIQIRDTQGGGGNIIISGNYYILDEDLFYAAAYNRTAGYIYDVEVSWSSSNNTVGYVTSFGVWTNFTAQQVSITGTCIVIATYNAQISNTTGILTVMVPTVDYIQIRDSPVGSGNIVTARTYSVNDNDTFYAAAYNNDLGYLYDIQVPWSINEPSVGMIDFLGIWANFTARWVIVDRTCIVTATYNSTVINSTGYLTVLAPKVDYIQIRDASDGEGNITTTAMFTLGETIRDTFYCAAYNHTVGYIGDREAQWEVTGGIGGLTPLQGTSTLFTATDPGTGTITADLAGITNSTGTITVNPGEPMDTPPSAPNNVTAQVISSSEIRIEWSPNPETDLAGYIVQRSLNSDGPWQNLTTVGKDRTSFTDSGLESDTTYYYRIIAIDNVVNLSPPSQTASAKTEKPGEFQLLWILIIIVIIIIVLLLILILSKKPKKSEEEPPPLNEMEREKPPPPPWVKQEEEVTQTPTENEITEDELLPPEDEEELSPSEDEIPEDELPPPDDWESSS